MTLIRKHTLYQLASIAWGVMVFGFIIVTISGNARPYVSPDTLPIDGPFQMIGVAVAIIALGVVIIQQMETREWKAAGKQAGLSPDGRGGLIGKPDLVGTIEGREVRARIESRAVGGGGESGSDTSTFTVVETDLAEPTDCGVIVTGGGPPLAGMEEVPGDISDQLTTVGDVAVLGESEEFARATVTPAIQNALGETDSLESVHAGTSADVFLDAVKMNGGGLAGSFVSAMESTIKERMPSGPETVATDRKGVILSGAELETRAQAVVAIADGFEQATEAEPRRQTP